MSSSPVFSAFHSLEANDITQLEGRDAVAVGAPPVSLAVSSVCNLSGCWMNEQRWLRSRPSSLGLLPCRSQRSGRTPETRRIFHQRIHFCPNFLLILPSFLSYDKNPLGDGWGRGACTLVSPIYSIKKGYCNWYKKRSLITVFIRYPYRKIAYIKP